MNAVNGNGHTRATVGSAIKQVMTPTPHTIGSDQKLATAHAMMREHALRHLPVLRAGKLVGVLSERDLYFVESVAGVEATVDTVADAMTGDVYTVEPSERLADVVTAMAQHRYGCAVIVDRGHVVGIFTATDALRVLADVTGAA
jgi:acetoin utilization protein AcuB